MITNNSPEILYEDNNVIGISKPYGMIVNISDTTRYEVTLQDWVKKNLSIDKKGVEEDSDFYQRDGIVHRLDKETSGIILIAKNEKSFKHLQAQFKNREIEKCYWALCHGNFSDEGRVAVPVGRLPWNRMRFGVIPNGRESITDFKPYKIYEDPDDKKLFLSLVKAYPKTGRTHQIRVHLHYLKYPIYADSLYAGRKTSKRDRVRLSRHFLHAKDISFYSLDDSKKITLSSDLPSDLSNFLKSLKEIVTT